MQRLEPGQLIERELAGYETHRYELNLISDWYLEVLVAPRDINVVVVLFAPDGQMIVQDDVASKQKTSIKLIVDLSGNHLLEVRPLDEAVTGYYQVQIKEMRTATEQDINRFAAEETLAEGMQLYKERTVESLQKAIAKFQEARSLWHTVGNVIEEARSLNNIGAVYNALGEKQQALKYYNQALPLWRTAENYPGLAATLNNIGKVHQ
ncbi:hypothetical protein NUACC21_00450 [Scytonema sp. NUACC21]